MGKWQYRLALVMIYGAFGLFVLAVVAMVASVTVLPMVQNYRHHGSIFLQDAPA